MRAYPWPGNIRELENALEHACVMCDEDTIGPRDLPVAMQSASGQATPAAGGTAVPEPGTLTLLAICGLTLLALVARRRKR